MSSGLIQVFVELRNLHETSIYVLCWIHGVRLNIFYLLYEIFIHTKDLWQLACWSIVRWGVMIL